MNLFDHEHINYNIDLSMLEHYRFCRHLNINLISHILGWYTSLDICRGYIDHEKYWPIELFVSTLSLKTTKNL